MQRPATCARSPDPDPGEEVPLALRLLQNDPLEPGRIRAAAAGDPAAREALLRAWAPTVHRFCHRMVGRDEDAADLAQEVLVRVLQHLDRCEPGRPFSTWVFSIARHACIDHLRRRRPGSRTEVAPVDPAPGPEARAADRERARRLAAALARLPPLHREVLLLHHDEHLQYREIAEILDLPLGAVMNRVLRARRRLRRVYEAMEDAP